MKLLRNLLATAVLVVGLSASAQSSFDAFGGMRTLVWPAVVTGATFSNAPMDLRLFTGIVNLNFGGMTNVNSGTLTATVEVSNDLTNYTSIANVAIATQTAINYTNSYYAANSMIATNTYLLPGTLTTPTASSAGFATVYVAPAQFTNTPGAFNVLTNGTYAIGFKVDDQPRYLHIKWTTSANCTVFGSLTGKTLGGPGQP